MPLPRLRHARTESLPIREMLAEGIERAAGPMPGDSGVLEAAQGSSGQRATATMTAVAVTALAATAAYVWWRRHEGTRGDGRPWRAAEAPSARAPEPAPPATQTTLATQMTPATLTTGEAPAPAAPAGAAAQSTVVEDVAAAELQQLIEVREDSEGGVATTAGALRPGPVVCTGASVAGADAVLQSVEAVEERVDEVGAAEPPAPEAEQAGNDGATEATEATDAAEATEATEATEASLAAALEEEAPASDAAGTPAPQSHIPRPPARSSLDPSTARSSPPEGRSVPRARFQPVTQRFTVPSPRPRLPGSHRSPLP